MKRGLKAYRTSQKIPIKRPTWSDHPWRMRSGMTVIPLGRRSIQCEMGMHRWGIRTIFGVPLMVCTRCGYRVPKPTIERTARKRELIERIQIEMKKEEPILPVNPQTLSIDERRKAKDKLILKAWKKYQEYKRTKTGKLKYVGDRR